MGRGKMLGNGREFVKISGKLNKCSMGGMVFTVQYFYCLYDEKCLRIQGNPDPAYLFDNRSLLVLPDFGWSAEPKKGSSVMLSRNYCRTQK